MFVLLMQLAEFLSYIAYNRNTHRMNKSLMSYATQLALMANLGQPLIATLALLPFSPARCELKIFTLFITFLYAIYTCYAASVLMSKYTVISKNMEGDYKSKPCISRLPNYSAYTGWKQSCMRCWENCGGHKANIWGKCLEYNISKFVETCFGKKEEDCHSHIIYPWWRQVNPAPYIICLAITMIALLRPISYMIYQIVAIFGVLLLSVLIFNDGEVGSQWCLGVVFLCILNPVMYYLLVKRKWRKHS